MKKFGWILTAIGGAAIIGGLLYPFGLIDKETLMTMMLGGAGFMFIGSMVRSFSILKR